MIARSFIVLAALLTSVPVRAGVASIWAVGDGEKISRDPRPGPLKARNAVWDGRRVTLFGARNEILAFQVIVEADGKGIGALAIALPELRQRGGSGRIAYVPPRADPSDSVGRPLQLFAVNYLNVTQPTHADWAWAPGSAAAPRDGLGWQPVQLVPENARVGRGGLPVKVGSALNQALWIEIYTGRDLPAGIYEGTITVSADGRKTDLPVELELLDFALPDRNSLDVMVFYEPHQPELYQGKNLDPAYHRFAHRNRVELVHAYDEAAVRASRGRFDGTDFTRARAATKDQARAWAT